MNDPTHFPETRWSLVLHAHDSGDRGDNAFDSLCESYLYLIYAHIRRRGFEPDSAAALTEGFLEELRRGLQFGKHELPARFRNFLFASLERFLAAPPSVMPGKSSREWSNQERRYQAEGPASNDVELAFDRDFAIELTRRALHRLGLEAASAGREEMYELLVPFLYCEPEDEQMDALVESTGINTASLQAALRRLRQRLRELVLDEMVQTVDSASQLKHERASLAGVLCDQEKPS
jgi:hypothetical protein